MYRVGPQSGFRTIAEPVLEFAFFQDDRNDACERLHRDLQAPRQTCLVVRRFERPPKRVGITDKTIPGVERLWNIEPCEAPLACFRVRGLVVFVQARRDIPSGADTVE